MNLIIVESPTKARTLSRFLGKDYRIEATMGHIRDLPKDRLGVDINKNFEPYYLVPKEKKKVVEKLKKLVKELKPKETEGLKSTKKYNDRYKNLYLSKIILATDLDREGEAIAWHTVQILNLDEVKSQKSKVKNYKRIVFHEITRQAVEEALKHPRGIDMNLVNAQQGRRVLDRLVGYKLSPLLWYKTGKNWLSAGRVQSVAVRLIVEKEREIEAFVPQEYWVVEVELRKKLRNYEITRLRSRFGGQAKLRKKDREIERYKDREKISQYRNIVISKESFLARLVKINEEKAEIKNKEQADLVVAFLQKAQYQVEKVERQTVFRSPPPPFITSTLQRAGANLFGWPARKTMIIAQNLYEQGLITYHRTDSVQLAKEALVMVREYINKMYGKEYLPEKPRIYKTKSKLAQEAHEAIRPTKLDITKLRNYDIKEEKNSVIFQYLNIAISDLGKDHQKLLELISKRFIACQMREEEVEVTKVKVKSQKSKVKSNDFLEMLLEAKGERQVFAGWRAVWENKTHETYKTHKTHETNKEKTKLLPALSEEEILDLVKILPQQKFTQPPARYNEASLIKALEEKGIGRPSTYAPIISTIQARQYVEKIERAFKPTELGVAVNDFLVENFAKIINVEFTAKMEDELDEIAKGKLKWVRVVGEFWEPFQEQILKSKEQKEKIKIKMETVEEKCPQDDGQLVIRIGKYGKFLACGNFPKCRFTKPLVEKTGIKCPKCRGEVVLKKSKKGRRFYGCSNYPECNFASWTKPK